DGWRQCCLVCRATTWSRATELNAPGLGLCCGAPVSHMSEQRCGSALGPLGRCRPPRKLSLSRNGRSGSVDLPNSKSFPSVLGNQLHSSILWFGFGSDMPLAVYIAQN